MFMLMICGYAAIGMRISSGWINSVKNAIKKALDSQQQFSQCAEFVRQIQFNRGRKNSYETAYQFKTDQSAFIEFNGGAPALKHVPQLTHAARSALLLALYSRYQRLEWTLDDDRAAD